MRMEFKTKPVKETEIGQEITTLTAQGWEFLQVVPAPDAPGLRKGQKFIILLKKMVSS
jgi:hypothetical protein